MERRSARSEEPRFGLKWKAFFVLLALLASVHLVVGLLGYRSLVRASEQQQRERMQSFSTVLDELLDESANALSNVAGVLATSIGAEDGEAGGLRPLPPQTGAGLVYAAYFDPAGRRLGGWDLIAPPTLDEKTIAAALAAARGSHRPQRQISCSIECLQLVIIPVFGRDEQELVLALAAPLTDVLPAFQRLTGADIAILADSEAHGLGPFREREIMALTNARSLLPRLQALRADSLPSGSTLLLGEARPAALAQGEKVKALFIVDQAATLLRIEQEFWRSIRLALAGLVLSGLVLYLLLVPPLRRLKRINRILPLLAERRYDTVRRELPPQAPRWFPDEIDELGVTTRTLNERLRQLDAAEAASEAKSRFLAVMSHEIRTPMNGVLGMLELLEQSAMETAQRDMLRTVTDSSQALLRVIDDILDFSKIESGRLELEQLPLSLQEIVEGAVETLAPGLRGRPLRLLSHVDPVLPPRLVGDPVRLRQILFNLIGNAIKFTERGQVLVRVQCLETQAGGAMKLRIAVEDSGIGISPEAQARLFQPFVQAESSTTRRYGGSGLGLSISQGLIRRMGSVLELRSTEGKGSCFWFDLVLASATPAATQPAVSRLVDTRLTLRIDDPVEEALVRAYAMAEGWDERCAEPGAPRISVEAEEGGLRVRGVAALPSLLPRPYRRAQLMQALAVAAGRALPAMASAASATTAVGGLGARILVAEDHPVNQQVIVAQLARLGYAADVADDGEAALVLLRGRHYAALLTDLHMPRMDGYALARAQRAREAAGESPGRLPIVALTANVLQGQAQVCLDAGMDDYMTKPLVLRELQERLQAWISHRALPQQEQTADAPAQGETSAPVDLELLKDCFGDDLPGIRQLLQDFLRINTPLIGQLQETMRSGSPDDVRGQAHRLLGSARTAGATRLAVSLACIEAAAPGASRELLSGLWAEAAREFAVVRDWTGRMLMETGEHPLPG